MNPRQTWRIVWLALGLTGAARALLIDGYTAANHDRYVNDPAFIGAAFDLSGTAISSDGKWATLIAPNVFLTARHFPPAPGATVTFRAGNDPAAPGVTRTVSSVRTVAGESDLLMCTLTAPVTESIAYFPTATATLPRRIFSTYAYYNENLYHVGRSQSAYALELDLAVGRNRLDNWSSSVSISGQAATGPGIVCTRDDPADANYVESETAAQIGDSGAPLFSAADASTLEVVGISWYVTQNAEGAVTGTGFTPVGEYTDALDSFLSANALPYQPLAPTGLTALRVSDSRIDLAWTDSSSVETGFRLERAESATGPWSVVTNPLADAEAFSDTAAPAGDVFYRLVAVNGAVDSESVTVSALTPYSAWAAQIDWGGADPSPFADANQDGLANLAAYGMQLSPVDPVPADALPTLEISPTDVDFYYRKNPDADDLVYTLRTVSDLVNGTWSDVIIDGVTITETDTGPVDTARLIRIRMPAASTPSPAHFRLRIESSQLP